MTSVERPRGRNGRGNGLGEKWPGGMVWGRNGWGNVLGGE